MIHPDPASNTRHPHVVSPASQATQGAGRILFPTLLALTCFLLLCNPAFASLETEVLISAGGEILSRSVTRADGLEQFPTPAAETAVPFEDGQRSTYLWLDTAHQNAIAEQVAITGDGVYGIAGWWLNNERTALYRIDDDNVPEWTRAMPLVPFEISVDADDVGARLTSTGREDSLYVFDASSPVPIQSQWPTPPLVCYHSAVSDGGNTYALGAGNPDGSAGELSVYDGSGAFRFRHAFPAPLEGICVSADGLVVAGNVRAFAKVFDAMTGALRDSIPIPGETQRTAVLSGDGSLLVTGGFSHYVRLFQWNGSEYVQVWSYTIPSTTWISALAISDDGSTVAAGTWTSPTGGKVVLFDSSSPTPLWTDAAYGDWVSSLSLTPNGSVLAAGSWGRQGATVYNIISVYDRASATPTASIGDDAFAGVGSCMSVDLSENGAYLIAGGKAVHARDFGNGGWVMAIELVDPAGAADRPLASASEAPLLLSAAPNPSTGPVRIEFSSVWSDANRVQVLTADGRRIRTLHPAAGSRSCSWDGLDEAGREAPGGTYFLRAWSDGDQAWASPSASRIVRVR